MKKKLSIILVISLIFVQIASSFAISFAEANEVTGTPNTEGIVSEENANEGSGEQAPEEAATGDLATDQTVPSTGDAGGEASSKDDAGQSKELSQAEAREKVASDMEFVYIESEEIEAP